MAFFEKLLGDKYKKELTHEGLEKLIEDSYNSVVKEKELFKAASDKNASEAADYKKRYTEKLSEAEKKELEYQELVTKNKGLVRDSNISKYTSRYIGLGYDEDLAKDTAIAQIDGNLDKVFENQKLFNTKIKEKFEKEKLSGTPKPPAGGVSKLTKEEFDKLGYAARVKLQETDPILYAELSK